MKKLKEIAWAIVDNDVAWYAFEFICFVILGLIIAKL